MDVDDVMPEPSSLDTPIFTGDQIRALWPQTRYELLAFERHLERRGQTIIAEQIRLAVMLASQAFADRWEGA